MESQSRYFSCSDFFDGNLEFSRDDVIRSSLSSRNGKRNGPKRPPQPSLAAVAQNSVYRSPQTFRSPSLRVRTLPGVPTPPARSHGLSRSYSNPKMEYSNDLNLNNLEISSNKNIEAEEPVEVKRTEEELNVLEPNKEHSDKSFGIDQWLSMKEQLDQNAIEDISNHSSISSEHSSIASSASAMARKAKSVKSLISKKFRIKSKSSSVMSLRTTDGGSSSHDSSESQPFKVKDSRKMPKTMLRHLDNVTLRQRLQPSKNGDPVIVMKFNSDGNLLATAGKDSFVYVWVLNKHKHQFNSNRKSIEVTPEFLAAEEEEEGPFCPVPLRKYFGHSDHVVDLSWSFKQNDNWLLSCSIDKTIKLWHISKDEAILTFSNSEIPKSVLFHPKDNCKFLAGFLDGRIEMWNIPNRKATHRYKADSRNKNGAAITSLLFLPKRDQAIFGTMDGRCILLDIRENDFFFHTELALSSQAVTGIEPVPNDPNQILVTSTDSRIRCYSLQDNSIMCRYKGFTNANSLGMFIKAGLSPDGRYIISGSEDGHVYSWEKTQLHNSFKAKRDKNNHFQYIKCHNAPVHSAIFHPCPDVVSPSIIMGIISSDENGHINVFTKSRPSVTSS